MSSKRLAVVLALAFFAVVTQAGDQPYTFTTLAGAPPSLTPIAPLSHPYDVAVDASGNLYISDAFNYVIRKLTPAGEMTVLAGTIGSHGSADGSGAAARFDYPEGIAVDRSGNVYVADWGIHAIRKITPSGDVTTFAGSAGNPGTADGPGNVARFTFPSGVATDVAGSVYVADSGNQTIRKITPQGVVTTIAGSPGIEGTADGIGSAAHFDFPDGLALDSAGNIYVADAINNAIRKITPSGQVTTLAGSKGSQGSADGRGSAAMFNAPRDIAIDASGVIYVADEFNNTIRRVTAAGDVTTFAGQSGAEGALDGVGTSARFNDPWGLGIDLLGNLYVADRGNNAIREISPQGLVTTLGSLAVREGSADGFGTNARFHSPHGIAVDRLGNVFVADLLNHTIRKIASTGEVTTFAGTAGVSGDADGVGAAARFDGPTAIAIDASGNLFVVDEFNYTIRKITPSAEVTTYAGFPGARGSADGPRASARFNFPEGIAVDTLGNIYVADTDNETIRMISASGNVITLAGSTGLRGTADGFRSAARFDNPEGLAVDSAGNVYVADELNGSIRKIAVSGDVTTFAGLTGQQGAADGNGANARFQAPIGIAFDSSGTMFVSDAGNDIIRKVTPSRDVVTIGGVARSSGDVDGAGPNARFKSVSGIAVDANGTIYVADSGNDAIRAGALPRPRRRSVR